MGRPVAKTLEQIEEEIEEVVEEKKEDKRALPRELGIERGPTGLYKVVYVGGGEVPDLLKGQYTTAWRAESAIANFKAQAQQ